MDFIRPGDFINLDNCPEEYKQIILKYQKEVAFLRKANDALQMSLMQQNGLGLTKDQLQELDGLRKGAKGDRKFINALLPMVFGDDLYRADALKYTKSTQKYRLVKGNQRKVKKFDVNKST